MPKQKVKFSPFSFLHDTLHILLVDEDSDMFDVFREIFRQVKVYNISYARVLPEGVNMIRNRRLFHGCVMFHDSRNADKELLILQNRTGALPLIIFPWRDSLINAYVKYRHKVKTPAHEKAWQIKKKEVLSSINRYTLNGLFENIYHKNSFPYLKHFITVLLGKEPEKVYDWAKAAHVSTSLFRKRFNGRQKLKARHVLSVYHLLKKAFCYYENCDDTFEGGKTIREVIGDPVEYRKLEESFRFYKEAYFKILGQ